MVTIPSKLSTDLWKTISNSYGATIRTTVLWFFSNRVSVLHGCAIRGRYALLIPPSSRGRDAA